MNDNERALLRYVVEGDIRKSQQQAKIVLEGLTTVKDKAFKETCLQTLASKSPTLIELPYNLQGLLVAEDSSAFREDRFLIRDSEKEFPPTRVTSGSAKHVYLVCKDCGYGANGEWHPMIAFACGSGEVHTGCPECARNSLRKVMGAHYAKTARKPVVSVACPQIAALWHPDNEFGPDMYTTGSCKNIPLVCPVCGYGKEKDWTPSIADVCRKGAKCPFCGNTVR